MTKSPAELFDLSGKVALITGGSRGLGREMALAFAAAGADVVIVSRKLAACEAVAEEIERSGRRALPLAGHVGHWDEMPSLVESAYNWRNGIQILVNNAGLSPLSPSIAETSEALFDKVVEINFKAAFRLSVLVGERMSAADGGSIINISSTGALRPTAGIAPYAGAKAGLNAMSLALSLAWAPKVRVNVISPGTFKTDIAAAWSDNPELGKSNPLGRIGIPNEIAGAALFLASDASTYVNGALIRVDGGGPVDRTALQHGF